ncbi:MAG: tetratricopeptide repeat protein [Bacteroidia bacterium]
MKKVFPYFIFFLFHFSVLFAQPKASPSPYGEIDSLRNLLKTEKNDTNKVNTLNVLSGKFEDISSYDSSIICANNALTLANSLPPGKGTLRGIGSALRTLGIIYYSQSNYPKALEYDFKALTIDQEIGDKRSIANNLGNIGSIYYISGNNPKAIEYALKALDIDNQVGNKNGSAANLGNLGNILTGEGNYSKALEYEFQALAIDSELGNNNIIAYVLSCIGTTYLYQGNYSGALKYNFKALAIDRIIGNNIGIAQDLLDVGDSYAKEKNNKQAKSYLDSALELSQRIGEKDIEKGAYKDLSELDSATGDYKKGWEDYKNYIVYRDSLVNEANTKKTVQAEMSFEFEQKQAAEKAEQDKKDAIVEQERKRQATIRNSFIGGFILMLALAFFIYRGYRQKQKANILMTRQKKEVERQKVLVEDKNREILDSITYAKYLQEAILPPLSLIKQYFPESFVLYKPKDIVAGDFYWVAPHQTSPPEGREFMEGSILIAAADCTGHGVPGAMVSVVCSNALDRTVKEFHITEPGKILDKVRELVLETFEKSENNVQDGMDISLAAISRQPLANSIEVKWSGAFNPLWYVHEGELNEIKADKQPIGMYYGEKPFTTHTLNIKKGDTLYLFTDGYADQFGGPEGKKFKYKQFQQLIMDNSQLTMEEQKAELEKTLNEWKGELGQMDDILIIGIKI